MRRIAHLSDLHFGRTDERVVPALQAALALSRPDLVVISGDLTQRARRAEFEQASAFLAALPFPFLVVPGNHDVPLYSFLERCTRPLDRYCRNISLELAPFFSDSEIAVAGFDTTRILTKNGRIRVSEVELACERLVAAGPARTRVIVTHHPFDLPPLFSRRYMVKNAAEAMELFRTAKVDLFLSGHLHTAHVSDLAARYNLGGYSALVVQAGTAVSTRLRSQPNSWNLIAVERPRLEITRCVYQAGGNRFASLVKNRFVLGEKGWRPDQHGRRQAS